MAEEALARFGAVAEKAREYRDGRRSLRHPDGPTYQDVLQAVRTFERHLEIEAAHEAVGRGRDDA